MITIVGLGNIGEEYALTRHNVGWMILKRIIIDEGLPSPIMSRAHAGMITEGVYHAKNVRMIFPHTYMNKSGASVMKSMTNNTKVEDLIVIHDDIDLPFGTIKISTGRGSSGHNGVKSIIDTLGTKEFTRIRIGITQKSFFGTIKRPKGENLSRFVLSKFTKKEMKDLDDVHALVSRALTLIATKGVSSAMEECNQ